MYGVQNQDNSNIYSHSCGSAITAGGRMMLQYASDILKNNNV